jgi:hypothetical protein
VTRLPQALLLLAMLTGCATSPGLDEDAALAPDFRFKMPSPAALGRDIDAVQHVTAHYREQSVSFDTRLSITPQQLMLVGLDSLGRRGLTVIWDGKSVESETAPWLPTAIRPQNMLADIGLLYWPEAAIRAGLVGAGAALQTDRQGRSITENGREIVHIEYDPPGGPAWTGTAHLRNLAFGYSLDIQSAAVDP